MIWHRGAWLTFRVILERHGITNSQNAQTMNFDKNVLKYVLLTITQRLKYNWLMNPNTFTSLTTEKQSKHCSKVVWACCKSLWNCFPVEFPIAANSGFPLWSFFSLNLRLLGKNGDAPFRLQPFVVCKIFKSL